MAESPWRDRLRPASFRGVEFHIEESARAGGRRSFLHEFPKRDLPYAEDMGRKGEGFTITGYLVGPDFLFARDELIEALHAEGPGLLILPTAGEFDVQPGPYSAVERRERGGFVEISMNFLEAGAASAFTVTASTQSQVNSAADAADSQVTATTTRQQTQGTTAV
ncbi:DNA circularization N-terminal domain-containing protein [Methylobacterium soli]|uniref:DNA circulation N-terminal domain-containing protein n=1 Tax=Methylobacterium soli TaxID=553447 RepID=A0A6L3T0G1_9HYPH|nr:DNA circularization N-terminal domain-containing protein [Methylobacterium soli]KAB1079415.1 hypothetical protein F6X53_11470 [Methylobacterium soli]GJE45370.1 hypothetical protein AEGHOMDF_4564 [Methylobacterium soli]